MREGNRKREEGGREGGGKEVKVRNGGRGLGRKEEEEGGGRQG